eukprot:scaffold1691_cov80-Phaeocystis_antarctica.AAC.3
MPVCRSRSRRSRQAANCAQSTTQLGLPAQHRHHCGSRALWVGGCGMRAGRGSSRASSSVPVRCVRSWQAPPRRYPHARERPPSRSARHWVDVKRGM